MTVRKLLLVLVVLVAGYQFLQQRERLSDAPAAPARERSASAAVAPSTSAALERAYGNRESNVQVQGTGTVTRLLADDNEGSRHQRFIVRLASGRTLLIAHNIDLAPRVAPLRVGDSIEFYGEYEWNEHGGLVHWTHQDPAGRHPGGWIRNGANRVQ